MKKVYILAYSKMNFGDDLFIDTLVKKYKKVQFYSKALQTSSIVYQNNENLHFLDYSIDDLLDLNVLEFDAIVYIGGSIFMEHKGGIERVEKLKKLAIKYNERCIPFYYISSNFGPYIREEYKNTVRDIFLNCTDVCLRDMYSYNLFKDIENVRYCPDAIFSTKIKKSKREEKTIGISIIDFKFREELKNKEYKYKELLVKSINRFIENGYKVKLFSFCQYEGDEDTAKIIMEEIENKEKIESIVYKGNVDEFLKAYSKMEYAICSRFHAMVLSYLLEQKICVLSYSDKITNTIKDLNLLEQFYEIKNIDGIDCIKIQDFQEVNYNKNIIKEANNQFKKLDELLQNAEELEEKVTVIIPAYNEEKNIQKVVNLVKKNDIVNQILVVDNNSSDNTSRLANECGAQVVFCERQGKGYAMKEGLNYAKNSTIVYLDADISNYSTNLINKLVMPIIADNADFVKSMFDRTGGRVTELVAKPMLDILFPEIYKFSQPLSGMIAGKKELFQKIEFENDYGVDIGILLDVIKLGANVQEVHIGRIKNASQQLHGLNKMAKEVMLAILKRAN